jgi:3'-phosphoadenosine 5'-phosphosulfate sulfotransferase (PAPS reductase)/FAD synthetase
LTFELMCEIKGRPPSRKAQFCTEKLKLIPQRRYCQGLTDEIERYTGVRRQESEFRKNTPARQWDTYFDCWVNNPIFDWKKEMCFDYVKHHGEEFNPLYLMGFWRVGCAPCVNSGKDDILLWADRRPDAIVKVRNLEERTGKTFFAPMVPGMALNFIDDVLAWAKTSHGGRQFRILPERENCESKYGLCE